MDMGEMTIFMVVVVTILCMVEMEVIPQYLATKIIKLILELASVRILAMGMIL